VSLEKEGEKEGVAYYFRVSFPQNCTECFASPFEILNFDPKSVDISRPKEKGEKERM
jgi:hypothetical protein